MQLPPLRRTSLAAGMLVLATASSLAAQERRLDLGGAAAIERTVAPGTRIALVLTNIVPRLADTYTVLVRQEAIPLDTLPLPDDVPRLYRKSGDGCGGAREALDARLDAASNEISVKRIVDAEVTLPSWAECSGTLGGYIRNQTHLVLEDTFVMRPGQRLVVEVTRPGETRPAQWRFVFATEPRGEWRAGYGFTFIPRVYPQYYTEQVEDDPTKFEIRREGRAGDFLTSYDFIPSILFTWLPSAARYRNWSGGLTAGLGSDLDEVALFGGLAGTFNENVTLAAGLTIHEQPRLASQFSRGQIITEDLDSEVLHENRFGPNLFFGISFRFGRNPFSGTGSSDEAGSGTTGEARLPPGSEAPQRAAPRGGPVRDDLALNPAAIRVGATVGGFVAQDVKREGGKTTVVFRKVAGGEDVELSGTYTLDDTRRCLVPAEDAAPVLPHAGGARPERLCFAAAEALTTGLRNVKAGDALKVRTDGFTLEWDGAKTRYSDVRVTGIAR